MYALNGDVNVAVGKLIVTSHDTAAKRIEGTFEFEASPIISATPNYSITEGAFDIIYE